MYVTHPTDTASRRAQLTRHQGLGAAADGRPWVSTPTDRKCRHGADARELTQPRQLSPPVTGPRHTRRDCAPRGKRPRSISRHDPNILRPPANRPSSSATREPPRDRTPHTHQAQAGRCAEPAPRSGALAPTTWEAGAGLPQRAGRDAAHNCRTNGTLSLRRRRAGLCACPSAAAPRGSFLPPRQPCWPAWDGGAGAALAGAR